MCVFVAMSCVISKDQKNQIPTSEKILKPFLVLNAYNNAGLVEFCITSTYSLTIK